MRGWAILLLVALLVVVHANIDTSQHFLNCRQPNGFIYKYDSFFINGSVTEVV
jgi:hypothetical protein